MPVISPAPTSALRRIDAVFGAMTAPAEGCLRCCTEDELSLLAVARAPLGDDLVRQFFDVWWRETPADPAPVYGVGAVWKLRVEVQTSAGRRTPSRSPQPADGSVPGSVSCSTS